MNGLLNRDKSKNAVDCICVGESTITDCRSIADEFVDYFARIGETLDSALEDTFTDPCQHIVRNLSNFYLFPTNIIEIENIIKKLKITKTEINTMPVRIFRRQFSERYF